MTLVKLENVTYSANQRLLFRGLSAEFRHGEKVAIVGEVGSGRIDLLNLMTGTLSPEEGSVSLFGTDINGIGSQELNHIRQRIGFVFQNTALISNLKVIENVTLPLLYHTNMPENEIYQRGIDLLDSVGYNEDIWTLPGLLPVFKKKAVAFARALVLDPEIVIYDRFLEGLDHRQRTFMISLIDNACSAKAGRLSIFTANHADELNGVSISRVLSIKENRLVDCHG